ncbi:transcription, partial [Aspergillus sp. HF37]
MATPPPEAAPVLKEEKPQLPASPNGAPAESDHTGMQDLNTDAKANVSANGTDGSKMETESKPTTTNGTSADQSSFTNGLNATASPPKSPAVPPADSTPQPAPPAEEAKMESSVDEMKTAGEQPTPDQLNIHGESADNNAVESKVPETSALESGPPETAASGDTAPEKVAPENAVPADATAENQALEGVAPAAPEAPENSVPENPAQSQAMDTSQPLLTDPSLDTNMETTPAPQESVSVKTELPQNHPQPNSEVAPSNDADATVPSLPPSQPPDQEMPDAPQAPMSPTKLSRERETDSSEEPAAKRTKVEGEEPATSDFKVPELPTPTTEPPAESPIDGKSGMTKLQHKFLVRSIGSLKRMPDARFYREPVDPIKLKIPQYPEIIKNPMDLGTLDKKLKNNEYPSAQAVIDDFSLMVQNSVTFNGPEHPVAKAGLSLKATFEKQMTKLPRLDEVEEKKPKKAPAKTSAGRREPRTSTGQSAPRPAGGSPQATTFALGPEGLPLIRRDSANPDGRPKRSIHPPKRDLPYSTKPKKKKYQWELRFCQETLDEVHKPKHYAYAAPFYYPVDPVALNIPSYHSVIKTPMDLSTMQSKLRTGQYEHAKEFETDMRQMFKNCFKFNIPGDPTYAAGQRLEEVFNNKWAGKKRYLEVHDPPVEHQSVSSSDEGSDDDAEESEEEYETQSLTTLQKQMAELSRQMEAISQKKKKTPPGSKKAGKPKPAKKDTKDSKKSRTVSFGKKDKKSKLTKPEKDRWVTYHEKQLISNGISNLTDKKMQEALKIIQSNVPALK